MERLISSINEKFHDGDAIRIEEYCRKMVESSPLLHEIMLRIEAGEFDDIEPTAIMLHLEKLLTGPAHAPARDRVIEMIRRRWWDSDDITGAIDAWSYHIGP
jgi:hypothetical protein